MNEAIFKVQIPIVTNDPSPYAMVYNEDRSLEFYPPVGLVEHLFKKKEVKVFVYGEIHDKEVILTSDRAPWQDW